MALDEPKNDDQILDRGQYRILLDPQIIDLLKQGGGLNIDYVDDSHQKGYMLKLNSVGEDACGTDAGGCSGCG